MRGLKKVTQIGNLGNDPIIQNLEGNIKVAKFSLATSESKDTNGQNQTITDWHNIVSWRSLADFAEKYLHKGSLIYLEGKLKNRTYEDKDGQKRYVTEIIIESFLMLDKASHEAIEGFCPFYCVYPIIPLYKAIHQHSFLSS